jgi:hypothetical protein
MEGMNMIKKCFVILEILFLCCCIDKPKDNMVALDFIKQDFYFLLKLPYEIDPDCSAVFSEDTPLAIDIIDMVADGKKLPFVDDFDFDVGEGRNDSSLIPINPNQKEYFIIMFWYKGRYTNLLDNNFKSILWNNGQGFVFTVTSPNRYKVSTKSYEIEKVMRNIQVTYRIRLPDRYMPYSGYNLLYLKENRYSKTYTVLLNLKSVWNE